MNRPELTAVNQLLPTPGIDNLHADLQVMCDLRYRPAGRDKIQDLTTKLRRMRLRHLGLHGLLDD
jgi:hypothetical protein